jgi:chemotaxis protein methyltransferase CheR
VSAVQAFREVLAAQLGLQFEASRAELLAEVLARRARAAGLPDTVYLERLRAGASPGERRALARELTIGETYFFRNREQFDALLELAREHLRGPDAARRLRVLSAGCATGEEPYTIAMALADVLPSRGFSIRAVDLNAAALARALRGRYSAWALRETPEPARARFFRQEGAAFVLDREVRAAVSFDERNLADDDPELWATAAYDVVFCRNVAMYFSPDNARALVARIQRALRPGGHLFLGHAETLRGLSQAFDLCHTHGTFYHRRRTEEPRADEGAHWPDAIDRSARRVDALARQAEARPAPAAPAPADEALAALLDGERFADALALLDTGAAPSSGETALLRAALFAQAGRFAEAERACRALLAEDALSAGAHYLLALCSEGSGDKDAARAHDRMAAHLDPSFAMPRLHLGLLARRAGDREGAARELLEASRLLRRELPERLRLFGGGFGREALAALCRAELAACGAVA